MLHVANFDDIKAGRVTDVYFTRTLEILKAKGIDKHVKAEIITKSLPDGWEWAILAGVEESTNLLTTLNVSTRCMLEGTLFRPFQPVMEIEGMYTDFCVYETALLGFLCQASGVVTKAARCRKLAGDKSVISFGARRMHPALAPMIERNAYVGGCDGVATVVGAELLGIEPSGTMPHALILVIGSTVEATRAFDEVIPPRVRRVSLIDTFNDEKFEAIYVAEAMGKDLYAMRLDTPASRRGNFRVLLQEVRWELDLRGFHHIKLFVSGGLDEPQIVELRDVADAFGVGTSISNAPVVDFALDIIEIEGKPIAKRGKMSGSKNVWRCDQCFVDVMLPLGKRPGTCPCGGQYHQLLEPLTHQGKLVKTLPKPRDIRSYVLQQLANVPI